MITDFKLSDWYNINFTLKKTMSLLNTNEDIELMGTKKRRMPTSALLGKFDCKKDFIKYFREHRKYQL